eukprot:882442-Pelagomonas_calceolata.AAC.5
MLVINQRAFKKDPTVSAGLKHNPERKIQHPQKIRLGHRQRRILVAMYTLVSRQAPRCWKLTSQVLI